MSLSLDHNSNDIAKTIGLQKGNLTADNYEHTVLRFQDRQAGVSVVFDAENDRFAYNAYCIETTLLKELFSCEYDFLEDAINVINAEFGTWERFDFEKKSGCGSCAAK